MSAFKTTAVILAMGLSGLVHAEQIATWTIEGHVTGINVPEDPTHADLWAKFAVGQNYVLTFKVDLDALPSVVGEYAPVEGSVQFTQAGLSYQPLVSFGGISVWETGLELGYGYGALQGGSTQDAVLAYSGSFSGDIGTPSNQTLTLREANAAIAGGKLSLNPAINMLQFGFVDNTLTYLGANVYVGLDKLTTSAVPEADAMAMVLAGGLSCLAMGAMRRRRVGAKAC